MKVRKLRTSFGSPEGRSLAGAIIDVPEKRAKQLIDAGLAEALMPGDGQQLSAAPLSRQRVATRTAKPKAQPPRPTQAPVSPAGGPTGAKKSSSSSPAAPAPTEKTSGKREGGRKSSASTKAGS